MRRRLVLDLSQVQLILGSLMGDGHIEGEAGTRRLVISEPLHRAGYVWWKYERLSAIADLPPTSVDGRVSFSTIAHPIFDDLAALLAVPGEDLRRLLLPLGRAVRRTDSISRDTRELGVAETGRLDEPRLIREG